MITDHITLHPPGEGIAPAQSAEHFEEAHDSPGSTEEPSRLLVESVKDCAIFMLDPHGIVATWNAGAQRINGYEASEIVGRHFSLLYTEEDIAEGKPAKALSQANEYGNYAEDGWRVRKDSSRYFASVVLTALRDENGGLQGFAKVTRDSTEWMKAAAAVRESEARLRFLAEFVPQIVWTATPDGDLDYYNCHWYEYADTTLEQSRDSRWVSYVHIDDVARTWANWNHAVEAGKKFECELRLLRASDQSYRWHLLRAEPMCDEGGKIIKWFGMATDVNDFKAAEARMEEANATLEARVASRTAELEAAKKAAEAASHAKGEFLANISHEIRTPLSAVIGYADLLSGSDRSPAERAEFVDIIRRNGEHLLDVINDLLDISKIEAGKMTVECIPFSPTNVLAEIESVGKVRAAERRIDFNIECRGPIPSEINGDPTRVRQILLNLVSNAVRFTEKGSVRVVVSANSDAKTVRFDVIDTGIGLTSEQQASLFQPFTQADASTSRRFGGTGLGLSLCKRLVELLGGQLTVVSKPGEGSVFSFQLNYKGGTVSQVGEASSIVKSRERCAPSKVRVLLAEDGVDNRRLVTIYLEDAGMFVECASNGRIAVDRIVASSERGEAYDVVLMDMQMPELDGYDATRELRARGFADLPVIAFTAHAMTGEREKCLGAGCDDVTNKPIDPVALVAIILDYVGGELPASPAPCRPQADDDTLGELRARNAAQSTTTNLQDEILRSKFLTNGAVCRVLPSYVGDLPNQVNRIHQLLAKRDMTGVRRLVHKLRGSGGSFGFPDITRLAMTAEASVSSGREMGQIELDIRQLVDLVRRVEGYDRSSELALQSD